MSIMITKLPPRPTADIQLAALDAIARSARVDFKDDREWFAWARGLAEDAMLHDLPRAVEKLNKVPQEFRTYVFEDA